MSERGMTGGMIVAIAEARDKCRDEPDVIERLKKAMKVCKNHWMETDQNKQFQAALVATIAESPHMDVSRIIRSKKQLDKLDATIRALQCGVAVDIDAMAEEKRDEDIIPLMRLWSEVQ